MRLQKLDNTTRKKTEHEISRINKLFASGKPLLDLCRLREPDFVEASAAGSFLQSFYNGVESIILLLFKGIGEKIPVDLQWHKKLFEMAFQSTATRPLLFRSECKEQLAEYLSFRHFFRHSYGSEIDWKRLKPLVTEVEALWNALERDINEFVKTIAQ